MSQRCEEPGLVRGADHTTSVRRRYIGVVPVSDPAELDEFFVAAPGPVVVLTGAGISADSGVPTFRGPEGYWRIGSRNYRPQEVDTGAAFDRMPLELWGWYLYRRGAVLAAEPNAAHRALVRLERELGDEFVLITQNVDGLHRRAGSSDRATLAIHGSLIGWRCAADCPAASVVQPFPEGFATVWPKDRRPTEDEMAPLHCATCGRLGRPHVLWFDERYDEQHYRLYSAMAAADSATLLVVVGTAGETNLPDQIVRRVMERGQSVLVVNRDRSPFTRLADRYARGLTVLGGAAEWVPRITDCLLAARRERNR